MTMLTKQDAKRVIDYYIKGMSVVDTVERYSIPLYVVRIYRQIYAQIREIENLSEIKCDCGRVLGHTGACRKGAKTRNRLKKSASISKVSAEDTSNICACGGTKQPRRAKCANCIRNDIERKINKSVK